MYVCATEAKPSQQRIAKRKKEEKKTDGSDTIRVSRRRRREKLFEAVGCGMA
jgi:hypothetical protein